MEEPVEINPPEAPTEDGGAHGVEDSAADLSDDPTSGVRYDFEDDMPAHLPPEMFEEWRHTQLHQRAARQTHRVRWRTFALVYGAGGILIAYLISGLFHVGPAWFRPSMAIACGVAIWDIVARGKEQLAGVAAYGGTAFIFIAFGIVNGMVHPVAITLTPLYAAVGGIMAIAARSRRWDDFDSF